MITKFKLYSTKLNVVVENNIFENINEDIPQEGDYILHKNRRIGDLYDILAITIGKIIKIRKVYNEAQVIFDVPIGLMFIDLDKIEYWSKDRENLEALLAAKKYNL